MLTHDPLSSENVPGSNAFHGADRTHFDLTRKKRLGAFVTPGSVK
jgi:hypothetical protein